MISGLSKIKKHELRPSVKIDLSVFADEECFVELCEPTAAALFPDAGYLEQLRIKFPEFPNSMLYQINLLGRCYVVQPNDPESFNATHDFANLARTNKDCFYFVLSEFLNAYPTADIKDKVTEAKND